LFQRCSDQKIRVCGKDAIPLCYEHLRLPSSPRLGGGGGGGGGNCPKCPPLITARC